MDLNASCIDTLTKGLFNYVVVCVFEFEFKYWGRQQCAGVTPRSTAQKIHTDHTLN